MSFTPTYETVHQETNSAFTNEPSQMLFVILKHFRETYAVIGTIKTMLYEPMKELKFPPVVFMTIMLIRQHSQIPAELMITEKRVSFHFGMSVLRV